MGTSSRLRVALDGRRLQDNPLGGVGRSLAGVIDRIAAEADVVLLTDARRPPADTEVCQVALRPPARAPETVWLQWNVARWLRTHPCVFHGTFNALPYRSPAPAVVTIHDLSFEVHPEGFSRAKRRVFQLQARHAARTAASIIAPSSFTKHELVTVYGADTGRVHVAPWGVEARFGPARAREREQVCRTLGINGRYVVAMGGAPRRGLAVAVAAWQRVRAAGCDVALVVVGAEVPPALPGVVTAGAVDDETWAVLLAGAEAFCYPTRYEGFGVPALEGIASGTPVVCAPVASLPEILGDAAEWCDDASVPAIAAGLLRVLADPARAAARRDAGLARAAAHPGWDRAADVMLDAYCVAQHGTPRRREARARARARSGPT